MKYILFLFIFVIFCCCISNKNDNSDNAVKPPVSPHRDKNGSIIVDNEEAFEADKATYGLSKAYENARKGKYNM